MRNAGNRKDIRQAEKLARLADTNRAEFTRHILSTTQGRQWMWDILSRCHIFHNPMNDSERWTTFALGEMNVGQQLVADIMANCPEQYVQMQREANERANLNDARDDNVNPGSAAEFSGSEDADGGIEGRADTEYDIIGADA